MAIRLSSENKGSVNMELCKTALAARYAQEAKTASERAQAAAVHPPVIGGNGNWQIWDQGSGAYVDSGLRAAGPAGEAGNYTKPAAGIPEEDLSQDVRNKLNRGGASDYADLNNKPGINGVTLSGNKTAAQLGLAAADDVPTKTSQLQNDVGFLTQHQSLAAYRTSAAQDTIDAGKQAKIAASGMLKGDGNGGVSAATPGTDYLEPSALATYRTASAQDVVDAAQNAQIETLAGSLATIESNPATAAHAKGDYIVYNRQLYTVTATIAAGQTLTPGTNIAVVSNGGFNDLKNKLPIISNVIADSTTIEAGEVGEIRAAVNSISGFKASGVIGIVGMDTRANLINFLIDYNDQDAVCTVRNNRSTSITISPIFVVLYLPV